MKYVVVVIASVFVLSACGKEQPAPRPAKGKLVVQETTTLGGEQPKPVLVNCPGSTDATQRLCEEAERFSHSDQKNPYSARCELMDGGGSVDLKGRLDGRDLSGSFTSCPDGSKWPGLESALNAVIQSE